jgi:magnesium and cobalt transporter
VDDIIGVVYSQDLLQVADTDLLERQVRELMRPVLFMPETKIGSELLREMRQQDQTMAVIIDEHGSVAGIATMEDLVEEIVGVGGADSTHPRLEMVREGTSSLVMRGSTAIGDVEEMLGVHFGESADETVTTIAGLLSHVSGKVPAAGEKCDLEGFRFEVLEANQRKVLRVKIQKLSSTAMHASQP